MKQLRNIQLAVSGLHIREAAEGEEQSRTIEGHACVFGQRSVNLVPWSSYREVYEVMEPGCITDELLRSSDVVLTAFHNNELILGRSTNGEGTLKLSLDERGLLIRCELPHTQTADDMLELIKRGDISGMSFAYTADEEDTENGVSYERMEEKSEDGKDVWVRHVKRVSGLYDVTIAGHPAYPQADIAQREAGEGILKKIDEPIKAAEEAIKQREQAQRKREREAINRETEFI